MKSTLLDISTEFEIYPYNSGIQLRPPAIHTPRTLSVKDIYQLPSGINCYFLNLRSELQNANASLSQIFDAPLSKLLGKSLQEICPKKTNHPEIHNDKLVFLKKKQYFFEESTEKDDCILNFLSLKLPWYTSNNALIGLFGFSVQITPGNISLLLNLLTQWGLLNGNLSSAIEVFHSNISSLKITPRESTIIKELVLGKSASIIANTLNISKRTVETHIENIKNKLGVTTRVELMDKFLKLRS